MQRQNQRQLSTLFDNYDNVERDCVVNIKDKDINLMSLLVSSLPDVTQTTKYIQRFD